MAEIYLTCIMALFQCKSYLDIATSTRVYVGAHSNTYHLDAFDYLQHCSTTAKPFLHVLIYRELPLKPQNILCCPKMSVLAASYA